MQHTLDTMQWALQARALLKAYARETLEFTCPEAMKWCYEKGLAQPESPKRIGPTFAEALIATNMVNVVGTRKSIDPKAKGRMVALYRSHVCEYFDESAETRAREFLADLKKRVHTRQLDVGNALMKAYEFGKSGRTT